MEKSGYGGDLADLREQNMRRIIAVLLGAPEGLSQPDIAGRTELSRSTVSSLVKRLDTILAPKTRRNGHNNGRPLTAWSLVPSACLSVGIDIGRAHVSAVITNVFGQVVIGPMRQSALFAAKDPHAVLALVTGMIERLAEEADIDCEKIAVVTVGLPGPVDRESGRFRDAAAPIWASIDVRDEIRKRWPTARTPMRLADNKANLGALAEHRFGAGRTANSLLFVDWSSAIGAGLILGGQLWHGASGVAGEIGHLPVEPTGDQIKALRLPLDPDSRERCPHCRQRDCLNSLVGGLAVSSAINLPSLSAVVKAAQEPSDPNNDQARTVLKIAARLIGQAIGPVLTLLNVEMVIIGGAVGNSTLYPLLVEDLSLGVESTVFDQAGLDASFNLGELGQRAPVLGAATLGLNEYAVDFLIARARDKFPGTPSPATSSAMPI